MLICRVAKDLPVLELLNHFIKSSTVVYKRVAYKKNLVYVLTSADIISIFRVVYGYYTASKVKKISLVKSLLLAMPEISSDSVE